MENKTEIFKFDRVSSHDLVKGQDSGCLHLCHCNSKFDVVDGKTKLTNYIDVTF